MKTGWGLSFIHFTWGKAFWETVDVSSMVTPGKYGVTPLMQMATAEYAKPLFEYLREKDIPYDQVDAFGNSVESERNFFKNYRLDYTGSGKEIFVENLKRRPLQDSLWDDYLEYPYPITEADNRYHPTIVFPEVTRKRTIEGILYVVRRQEPQTSLHRAFLQIEVNDHRRKANRLWRSLFKAYDGYTDRAIAGRYAELAVRKLKAQSRQHKSEAQRDVVLKRLDRYEYDLGNASQNILEKRAMPLAARALAALSVAQNSEAVETILSTGGTFGINFSRKISELEGRVIFQKCRAFGEQLAHEIPDYLGVSEKLSMKQQSLQKIKDSLFRDDKLDFNDERKKKLLNHRLNCAVVTLIAFITPGEPYFHYRKTDEQFSNIDNELQSVVPVGHTVNSRKRFEKLYDLYRHPVYDDMPYYPPQ